MLRLIMSLSLALLSLFNYAQVYEYTNGRWWINRRFVSTTVYTVDGLFAFSRPTHIDSTIDLKQQFCIPPFSDAHTHNLDGTYNLSSMVSNYLRDGIFYVQVLGNHGKGTLQAREALVKINALDATYANGLLTATYGHGFYPYEPLALGIYSYKDQMKLADSIKKSRTMENDAYYFLDSIADVDKKWPLIKKYQPDHIKICLLDALHYEEKRRAEVPETYGLSAEVAAYVVKKAHAEGLRVFAHVETAEDARLCARIGVDVLAHLPGYGWDGKEASRSTYCMTESDARLFRKAGMAVIPTMNIDHTSEWNDQYAETKFPERAKALTNYHRFALNALLKMGVPIALGSDYYGKTTRVETDSLISQKIFSPADLLDIYCRQTPQVIFPNRKIGLIKNGYEGSFLVLKNNPLQTSDITDSNIMLRVRKGRMLLFK